MLREVVVRNVKPLLSAEAWQRLRRVDPTSARRDLARRERDDRAAATRPSLTELATKYGTDKWGTHRYTPHYERHLSAWRDAEIGVLEIGIGGYDRPGQQGGASLRMWKEFFPRAQVVGLDIEDKSFVDQDRITTVVGSQIDPPVLDDLVERFSPTVIIDDGSHQNAHIIATFSHLFPRLPDGGIYVIEDTQTSYWPNFGGTPDPTAPTSMNFVKSLLDGLHYEEYTPVGYQPTYTELQVCAVHVYHNIVFIEKGLNDEQGGRRRWSSAVRAAQAWSERQARQSSSTTAEASSAD